ncbi:putative reverse transcriptase domain-containing protein [Tanacetum coccineum]
MTRSSASELFTPYEEPGREFRSSRKHFKTLSLYELRSPDFNLFSDQEVYSEEEVAETMAETMEQYMSKNRADYGSGVARPKIEDKDHFELKGQFLKELRENTFSGSNHEDVNEHIEKVLEIILDSRGAIPTKTDADAKVDIQEIAEYSPKWHNGTSKTRRPYYTKYCPLKEEGTTLEEAYYTQFGGPFQGGGYRTATPGFYQRNNANPSQMSKVLQENGFGSLPSSIEANPRDQVKSISTTIEADSYPIRPIESSQYAVSTRQNRTLMYETSQTTIPFPSCLNGASVSVMPLSTYLNLGLGKLAHTKLTDELADMIVKYPKGIAENVLVGIGKFVFPIDFIILDMPKDIKVPLILRRPFLSTARAKIDVFKRRITFRVGEERIIFKSVKPASSLIKRVYMLILRERMELDLEVRLMGETFVINRSLDPLNGDYIELNDLNEPFELRRNQGDDLIPNIEEGEVIEEFRTRDDELDTEIDDYPSCYDYDKKIHIDYFVVLEDIDAYRDEGMGDVIFGEPFLREVGIKARRFEGMITIYNGNESVSDKDKKNGISNPYQKLKGFYKGVLNSGHDYIRHAKTEEWFACGHISVHEIMVKKRRRKILT